MADMTVLFISRFGHELRIRQKLQFTTYRFRRIVLFFLNVFLDKPQYLFIMKG
jgi:hypothetical protein